MPARLNRSSGFRRLIAALLWLWGCASSVELVSKTEVEDKISRLRIGQSNKDEVQRVFGALPPDSDRQRWIYHFADRQFEISERRQGAAVGAVPFSAGVVATNTRAVVTLTFNAAGIVKAIEVERFFEEPFINEYWYLIEQPEKEPLESLARIGESVGFKLTSLDKTAGVLSLDDPDGKANIVVKAHGQVLRVTSKNPHHRLTTEYRLHSKRENAFANAIADSGLVQ